MIFLFISVFKPTKYPRKTSTPCGVVLKRGISLVAYIRMHYVTEIEFSLGFADCVSSRGSETRSALRRLGAIDIRKQTANALGCPEGWAILEL
jgi:hypothetical protein